MRCFLILLVVSAALCLGGWASDVEQDGHVRVEKTTNREKDEMVDFFRRCVRSLSINGEGAHFQMRRDAAKFRTGDAEVHGGAGFQFEFTLAKPCDVFYSPDKHGLKIFCVKRITAESLVLEYTSRFDHRSFGKNLITEDRGQMVLHPFTNP